MQTGCVVKRTEQVVKLARYAYTIEALPIKRVSSRAGNSQRAGETPWPFQVG